MSHLITSIPGSSNYFAGGIVAYSNAIKINQLGVDEKIIQNKGAVSEECAVAMAIGANKLFGTDYSIAVTGIAGPSGGTPEKPVGLVWMACCDRSGKVKTFKQQFDRGRIPNIQFSAVNALNLLRITFLT